MKLRAASKREARGIYYHIRSPEKRKEKMQAGNAKKQPTALR